ncbi:TPA: DUF7661 family protein [Serratia fonticola]
MGVQRKNDRWLVFRADLTERKFSRLYDIAIPDDMTEGEIAGWLSDIIHEAAAVRMTIRIECAGQPLRSWSGIAHASVFHP